MQKKTKQTKTHMPFNISFSKIRSIRTKFYSVESFLLERPPDILAFCETKLKT